MVCRVDELIAEVRSRHMSSGLTLKAFAEAHDVDQQRLYGLYSERWNPTASTLRAVLSGTQHEAQPKQQCSRRPNDRMFGGLASLYLQQVAYPRKRSARQEELLLQRHVLPQWGARPTGSITTADVLRLVDALVATGTPNTANRLLSLLNQVFTFAMRRSVIDRSPSAGIRRPHEPSKGRRILSTTELHAIWHGFDGALPLVARDALRFQLLTAQRLGEVVGAEQGEFSMLDGVWQIPPERTKNGSAHIVPMSELAIEVVRHRLSGMPDSPWLFPSRRGTEAVRFSSVSSAIWKACKGIDWAFTSRDLRRTAATSMVRLGASRVVVEKVLNHSDSRTISRYDWHAYDDEKRAALETWGRWLQQNLAC
jgi:integrase